MKHTYWFILFLSFLLPISITNAQTNKEISTSDITKQVFEKGLEYTDLDFYAGTLMLHGMSEFALLKGNEDLLDTLIAVCEKFGSGALKAKGNFYSYEAGGSGAAYLAWKGATGKLDEQVAKAAAKMFTKQKRSSEGILMALSSKDDQVFIDIAFAVTPYLLYAGLKFNNPEYIDLAVLETVELFKILRDEKTGLLHQARGYNGAGNLTEDNWSRGNGWGAFALSILVRDLPESHPKRKEVETLAKQFFTAVINCQDKAGMWHQEMTDPTSYVETSGSGLLLYGLGVVLEKNILVKKYLSNFKLGLRGFTSYIGSDGSVTHTCFSCLSPGKGTKADYRKHAWVYNDHHAFGPVVLAFAQAAKMGIDKIAPLEKWGLYTIVNSPTVPRTYATYARESDVAWENDRIAFRVYGSSVRDKVRSGIDIWAKSVEYPILDKWYKLNAEGKDYHTDRGEGCDFYHLGKLLGCGGIAVWKDDKAYGSETFDSYRIIQNQDDKVGIELTYNTWNVPGIKLTEVKRIEMLNGSNLFKVTSTVKSDEDLELTIAIGLTTYGKAVVYQPKEQAALSVWEQMDSTNGSLGTVVLADPKNFAGYAAYNGDELILIKVITNVPFTYYAGAGWDKSKYFKTKTEWEKYIIKEAKAAQF